MESMNPYYWFLYHARRFPERRFLLFEDRWVTYGEAIERIWGYARFLRDMGISPGDRVAVISRNIPEVVYIFLATSLMGAVFVPLNFRLSALEIRELIESCSPSIVFFQDEFEALVSGNIHPIDGVSGTDKEVSMFDPNPEDMHTIIYTSGTTGKPKGVVTPFRKGLFNALNADIFFYGLTPKDVMLITLPLFHSGGLFIQLVPSLYKGCRIVLHRRFSPELISKDVVRYGVTCTVFVTTMARMMADRCDVGNLKGLRSFLMGGEPVPDSFLRDLRGEGVPARKIYGQTETSILIWQTEELAAANPESTGIPVMHGKVSLKLEGGLKPFEVGEVVASGPILMKGYWEGEPLDPEGWLSTGDLAYVDEEGVFYLVGREKDMFISGGENVYPAEIERVASSFDGVKEVAVVGVPHSRWGEVGAIFYSGDVDRDSFETFLREKLASYKVPKFWIRLDSLPKKGEKVDKSRLKEIFKNTHNKVQ